MNNPFFKNWETPFGTPPFNEIKLEHYLPAFNEGIKELLGEIAAVAENNNTPTFSNTIEALEKSGQLLTNVRRVFDNLNSVITNDEMQKIALQAAPLLSKINDDIYLNPKLFSRIKSLNQKKDELNLNPEQKKLLGDWYKSFVLGGANLSDSEKDKLRKINEELSILFVKFSDNILKETNSVGLVIDNKDDLKGLPESVIQGAAETANNKGLTGKWAFTLQRASWTPFLQYSDKRELREKLYKAYINRGNNNNENDTKSLINKIVNLRIQKANLLGFKDFSSLALDRAMAKNSKSVTSFLNQLWTPAIKRATAEVTDMQKIIDNENGGFKLMPWDWWYYSEKVKKEKYDLDETMLRPYFKLENVVEGVFTLTSKLFGLKYVERNDIQIYHPDVKVYEVQEANGKHIGILYTDYFPRETKSSGAWMSEFRSQSNMNGKFISPVIYNCGNFSKPTTDKPALLSIDEVKTLFHEFGHGLHGLLSNVTYPGVSGTNVARDFVELPSQIMENWATEPEMLKLYAKHYQTGEVIPQDLIDKLNNAGLFNQGFETVEYLAASLLDMDWHTLTSQNEFNVENFEKESLSKMGIIKEINSRYQSTNFLHIFSSDGYASGYYSYIWAAVLDADAFEAFKETSLFDQKNANAYRKYILEKGGSEEPMELYKKFRGREPKIDALLNRRGLN
jgi:peptidyl-dipeptidase Dcp